MSFTDYLNGGIMALPTCTDDFTLASVPSSNAPPYLSEYAQQCSDDISIAILEGTSKFSVTIRKSSCRGFGLGVFALVGIKAGNIVGFYWGKIEALPEPPDASDPPDERIYETLKYRVVDRKFWKFYIFGSTQCCGTYINDPAGTMCSANCRWEEKTLVPTIRFDYVKVVATEDIEEGQELFVEYGEHFEDVLQQKRNIARKRNSADEQGSVGKTPPPGDNGNAEMPRRQHGLICRRGVTGYGP